MAGKEAAKKWAFGRKSKLSPTHDGDDSVKSSKRSPSCQSKRPPLKRFFRSSPSSQQRPKSTGRKSGIPDSKSTLPCFSQTDSEGPSDHSNHSCVRSRSAPATPHLSHPPHPVLARLTPDHDEMAHKKVADVSPTQALAVVLDEQLPYRQAHPQMIQPEPTTISILPRSLSNPPPSVAQVSDHPSTDPQLESSYSGSAPTQLFNLSDAADVDHNVGLPLSVKTIDFENVLDEISASPHQQSEDLAGIELYHAATGSLNFVSSREMSLRLNLMAAQAEAGDTPVWQTSLSPFFAVPAPYSDSLKHTPTTVDAQIVLTRETINAWILVSLAGSRIDGLRLNFVIHLSLLSLPASKRTLFVSKAAKLVKLARQNWFLDASNVSPEDQVHTAAVLPSESLMELRSGSRSANSSRRLDIVTRPSPGMKKRNTPFSRSRQLDLAVDMSSQDTSDRSSGSNGLQPSTMRTDPQFPAANLDTPLDLSMIKSDLDQRKLDYSINDGVRASSASNGDDPLDNKTNYTGRSTPRQSEDMYHRPHPSPPPQMNADSWGRKQKRMHELGIQEGELICEHPDCSRRFLNEAVRTNHMDVAHRCFNYDTRQTSSSPLVEDSVLVSDVSRSPYRQEAKREDSDSSEPKSRASSPVDCGFRARSDTNRSQFFVQGRVFVVLWHVGLQPHFTIGGSEPRDVSTIFGVSNGEAHPYIRCFLAIETQHDSCVALPIGTYDGVDANERNRFQERRRRAIIHDDREFPKPASEEWLFTKERISVKVDRGELLDSRSRLDLDRPVIIGKDTEIRCIGMAENIQALQDIRSLAFPADPENPLGEHTDSQQDPGDVQDQRLKLPNKEIRRLSLTSWEVVSSQSRDRSAEHVPQAPSGCMEPPTSKDTITGHI